ncbi:endonuclease/exonuclease/phosphatase family protein [Algoriphagus mannitolivorans]|uniref:endonuclease/exonuclease/phosphatase family protein n=1 Tax=Algoriphagus mannitolivorans TaxID=226504 RepID=UPI00041286F3|nr:endonuclease/exonuclease/phosphatase family protein [Algoriphagus mannitolivorans]
MILLIALSIFFLLATFIPLIKLDHWWIRIFDYPRLQKLIILVILDITWVLLGKDSFEISVWITLIGIAILFLAFQVWPYTLFGKKMIKRIPFEKENGIHLIVGNVYQFNTQFQKVVHLIQSRNPDVVFLVETNEKWIEQLQALEKEYPHRILLPKENTYGLAFYSKFPLLREEIKYLVDPEIPSIELDIQLDSGKTVTLYGIHPTPPVPGENEKSTSRDAEILIVGKKSKNNPNPSLVIGDLNDVAWSYTTSLFLKISEMADPRRGRGLYSTFHAKVPFFRWPLDHVFLSTHFGLSQIKVLPNFGSDHFPIEIKATLTPAPTSYTLKANGEEKVEARAKIIKGLKE